MNSNFLNHFIHFFKDDDVDEVCLNGIRSLCVFKKLHIEEKKVPFENSNHLIRLCQEFALQEGQRLDPYCPSAGGQIGEGLYRWHCLIPPASSGEALFSIRRHRFSSLSLNDFFMEEDLSKKLKAVFENSRNHILICGPTGSGKTSLLSCVLNTHSQKERVIVIEEYSELCLQNPRWVRLLSRRQDREGQGEIKLSFLVEESLRLRPDRMVLGEIRTLDALVFFETVLLGHHGSLATLHVSNIHNVRKRINTLLCMRGQSVEAFWEALAGLNNLWYVFLERGTPPKIIGVHSHQEIV